MIVVLMWWWFGGASCSGGVHFGVYFGSDDGDCGDVLVIVKVSCDDDNWQ